MKQYLQSKARQKLHVTCKPRAGGAPWNGRVFLLRFVPPKHQAIYIVSLALACHAGYFYHQPPYSGGDPLISLFIYCYRWATRFLCDMSLKLYD